MNKLTAKEHAREIIEICTTNALLDIVTEYENESEIYEDMAVGCATILVDRLVNGIYTPMQYVMVTNEITKMLDEIFCGE